ncbi:hypothetical protein CEXT_110711 [Caerostris extrusa]|uniref:Uncharacterized protein n=1 Tax=Caerostris extrusa TaxID=172846 RepID=A0AAV4XZP6_CAEEX|nr:hypothetical protein CEXT_110711 [Caerostris extrusa]
MVIKYSGSREGAVLLFWRFDEHKCQGKCENISIYGIAGNNTGVMHAILMLCTFLSEFGAFMMDTKNKIKKNVLRKTFRSLKTPEKKNSTSQITTWAENKNKFLKLTVRKCIFKNHASKQQQPKRLLPYLNIPLQSFFSVATFSFSVPTFTLNKLFTVKERNLLQKSGLFATYEYPLGDARLRRLHDVKSMFMKGTLSLGICRVHVNLTGRVQLCGKTPGRPQKMTLREEGRPENNNAIRSLMLQGPLKLCSVRQMGKMLQCPLKKGFSRIRSLQWSFKSWQLECLQ